MHVVREDGSRLICGVIFWNSAMGMGMGMGMGEEDEDAARTASSKKSPSRKCEKRDRLYFSHEGTSE